MDEEGIERADLPAARAAAISAARDVMAAEVTAGGLCLSCHIEVRDDQNCVVMVVPFREAVAVSGVAP